MDINYALLPSRIKAAVIDSIILIASLYLVTEVFTLFDNVPNYIRMIAFLLIFVLYDPIFTSFYGATIGHSYSGIKVKKEDNTDENINFLNAVIRFATKVLLGWVSLLTVTSNKKKKALHDLIAGSIVIEEK